MRKFLASLFAAKPRTPSLKTRLSLDAMEARYAPAGFIHPGDIRGFNPQPEPPILKPVLSSMPCCGGGCAKIVQPEHSIEVGGH